MKKVELYLEAPVTNTAYAIVEIEVPDHYTDEDIERDYEEGKYCQEIDNAEWEWDAGLDEIEMDRHELNEVQIWEVLQ